MSIGLCGALLKISTGSGSANKVKLTVVELSREALIFLLKSSLYALAVDKNILETKPLARVILLTQRARLCHCRTNKAAVRRAPE